MKKAISKPLTRTQRADLDALAALPDERIDTGDIPEIRDWAGAGRGLFYRPVKQQLTLRIDADVVAWFKHRAGAGGRYQSDMNRALRDYMQRRVKPAE